MGIDYRNQPPSTPLIVSFGSAVRAVDPFTGQIVWTNEHSATAAGGTLIVVGSRVIAAGHGQMTCMDAATGTTIWTQRIEVGGRPALLVEGDRIYVASNGEVQCVSLAGALLWHQPFKGQGADNVSIALGPQAARDDRNT